MRKREEMRERKLSYYLPSERTLDLEEKMIIYIEDFLGIL